MKKKIKRVLSVCMILITIVCTMPFGDISISAKATGTEYEFVYFGSYPQSRVTDNNLISTLNSQQLNWKSYGYYSGNGRMYDDLFNDSMKPGDWMKYADVSYRNDMYRAVKFSHYRPGSTNFLVDEFPNQKEYGYKCNTVYWFKYEPIKWRILDKDSGFVVSELLLDSQAYSNTVYTSSDNDEVWNDKNFTNYANDYYTSSIRQWLNNDFYNVAFSSMEKDMILKSLIDNSAFYPTNELDSKPSDDNVYLLSFDEAHNAEYGFSSELEGDESRCTSGTDYAKCQGLSSRSRNGYHAWLLRSARLSSAWACFSDLNGDITCYYGPAFVAYTDLGIRPAIRIDLTKYRKNEKYITATKYFAENTSMPENFGFYESVWKSLPDRWRFLAPAKVWTSLGDIGKVMTFSFDDLGITADYYDIYLTELIGRMNNASAIEEIESKAMSGLKTTWETLKNLLKSSDQWEESVKDGKKLIKELEGVFFEKKDKEVSEETKNALSKLLRGIYKNNPETFNKVFTKLNMTNVISGYITDGFNIANYFIKTVNAYQSAVAYKEYGQELFNILYDAAKDMENKTYSNWFKNAIDKYYNVAMSDNILISEIKDSLGRTAYLAYDIVFKDIIKNITYSVCAKALGCTAGAFAASAFAVSLAYNLTYQVLDRVSGMGDKATAIYIMNYISDVEKGLSSVEDKYQKNLTKYPTLKNAQNYSLAYKALRNTNLYLYQAAYNFSSINKRTDDMKVFTLFIELWKKINLDKGTVYLNNAKIVSVQCPVDVVIYDSSDNVVFKVVNEEITDYDENVTAMVFDGKKTILLPDDCDYRIEITPREKGKMDYYISELSNDYPERKLEYYDLPLVENNVYTGDIPAEQFLDKFQYSLLSNDEEFICNYDSINSNKTCGDNHVFGEWTVERESDCVSAGIKYHECKICGIRSAEYVEPLGHIDSNADEKCDRCGEKMTVPVTPPQPDPSSSCNHICHKGGISKVFYKIARFFWKLFKINKYCSCGAAHY